MFSIRTRIVRSLGVVLVAGSGVVMNGCFRTMAPQQPQPQQPIQQPNPGGGNRQTSITGTAYVRPGSAGDLSNSRIAIYRDLEEWYYNMPVDFGAVQGVGATVEFVLANLVDGTYYVDVWKDSDNSQTWTIGDFLGWFGNGALGSPSLTPFLVRNGQMRDVGAIRMYNIGIDGFPMQATPDR
jgi:hypothetical protein